MIERIFNCLKPEARKLLLLVTLVLFMVEGASAYTTKESETLKVWTNPVTLTADGKTISYLTVYENDIYDYTAFNMALVVPEGVTVARIKQGREWVDDIHLSERAASSHTITCGMPDATTIKIIAGSTSLADFFPDDEDGNPLDELFTLGLVASPDMKNGTYKVEIMDVKFVLSSADAYVLADEPLYTDFIVVGGVSEIDFVEVDNVNTDGRWFDLSGREVEGNLQPGIYIRDGEKIVVK